MSAFSSKDIPDLHDQVVIVTGGNIGLGLETIRQLGAHGPARIYLAARSEDKAQNAIMQLKEAGISNVQFLPLDLASFESVKAAASEFLSKESRLDILVNNAGIMMTPPGLTKEGYEIQFGTNVLGPALFTQLLLPTVQKTAKLNSQARVVLLGSAAHAQASSSIVNLDDFKTTLENRSTIQRYTWSKLADLLYAKALAERITDVKIIPVHPGIVATNLHHVSTGTFLRPALYAAISLFAKPVEKGALSQIWAAVSFDARSGQYYGPVGKAESGSKLSQDHQLQERTFNWIQQQLKGNVDVLE